VARRCTKLQQAKAGDGTAAKQFGKQIHIQLFQFVAGDLIPFRAIVSWQAASKVSISTPD
jgi:hypothetical protein